MDEILKDQRFAHIATDPRYKKIPKAHRKVKIDKRFQSIFSDKKFQVKYTVDKRGRPVNQSSSENFRKYYDLSSDDEDESEDEDVDDKSKTNEKVDKVKNKNSLSVRNRESSKISNRPKLKSKEKNLDALIASGSSGEDDSEKEEIDNDKEDNSSESNDNEDELKKKISSSQLDSVKTRSQLPEDVREKLHDLNIDYARGMGTLMSDSSSDEESSNESGDGESDLEHDWGELDRDAETTDTATTRLAICNMDWDRIRAVDLMVLCSSFLPSKGHIKSVTIYPSEFGMKRMKEEELKGPTELVDLKNKIDLKKTKPNTVSDDGDDEDEDEAYDDQNDGGDFDDEDGEESKEGSKYHMERLRQYQLKRLKYYYAVVVCDSTETASKLYSECDGLEYESSATKLDLRFIPDDVTFDQEPKEVCTEIDDIKKYEPRFFVNTALQQGKVTCTWDETDPARKQLAEKLQQVKGGDGLNDDDLRMFLASSSEDEDVVEKDNGSDNSSKENGVTSSDDDSGDDDGEKVSRGTNKSIEKYRNLLNKLQEDEEKKKNRDVEMEITWGVGLKEKTQSLVDKKLKKNEELTPFEQMIEKKKEKRKLKKEERKKNQKEIKNSDDSEEEEEDNEDAAFSDDDIPDDINLNDDYFKEELGDKPVKKNKNKSKNKKKYTDDDEMDSDEKQKQDELALLLMDDEDKDGAQKSHFSLEKIQKMEENQGKKKRKGRKQIKGKNKKEEPLMEDDFEIDLKDDRFSAVFSQPQFNIDPSDSHYRKTKAMDALINEKMSRKYKRSTDEVNGKSEVSPKPSKVQKLDSDLSNMISSIKKKTKGVK